MKQLSHSTLRTELAALFLLMLPAAAAVLLLGWGRIFGSVGPRPEPIEPLPAESQDFPPAEGGEWSVELTPERARSLMTVFFDSLEAPTEGGQGAGEGTPMFLTVYGRGGEHRRYLMRGETLEASVRGAAGKFYADFEGKVEADALRVRLDAVTEVRPMPVPKRELLTAREMGEPAGFALRTRGGAHFLLPFERSAGRAGTAEEALRALCRRADLDAETWRQERWQMWWLKAVGYVNDLPGSRRALESPDGLVPVGRVSVSRLTRALGEGGLYLARSQEQTGAFLMYWDPTTGLRGGCRSLVLDASAAAALGIQCQVWPSAESLNACHLGLSYAMQSTRMDAHDPRMAFTTSEEACHGAWELEETAQVLEGLCRYARASGTTQPEPWIGATANFLLFMQRDDGLFELRYDPGAGEARTPGQGFNRTVAQARGALALALAHRQLGVERFLDGAEAALAPLLDDSPSLTAEEARYVLSALVELNAARPSDDYVRYAGAIARHRRQNQVLPEEAPAEYLVGGTLEGYPPTVRVTADDLTALAAACIMGLEEENLSAAERAARYVARLQFVPENSYYLREPETARGGFREQPGSNLIKLQTVDSALRGLATFMRFRMSQ